MENILILLVGENPLTSFVVMDYLLQEQRNDLNEIPIPTSIILIHHKKNNDLANTLKQKINLKYNSVNIENINIKHVGRNGNVVIEKISNKLNCIKNASEIASIHFNCTSGTKSMEDFGRIAVDKFCKENNIRKVFSDLDPNFKYLLQKQDVYIPIRETFWSRLHEK